MIMSRNIFSDYGSESSASASWNSLDSWPSTRNQLRLGDPDSRGQQRSTDLLDFMVSRATLDDMRQEFMMNGYDSPYNPDEDKMSRQSADRIGMSPSSVYLRQKSWPAPEATPVQRLPRPKSEWIPSATASDFTPNLQVTNDIDMPQHNILRQLETITAEQVRVLNSLPNAVLYGLLRDLEEERNLKRLKTKRVLDECRFCKSNGERESYCRSHLLKDNTGRVTCPVLRKFVCKRCGARGDRAHTIKYCPLSTDEERIKSSAIMRSVRLASGRRRTLMPNEPSGDYVSTAPNDFFGANAYTALACSTPLDPLWADLEQKLAL